MIHLPDRSSFTSYQDRRQFLSRAAIGIATASAGDLFSTAAASAVESGAIRPFRVSVPDAELLDLRKRIRATR